MWGAWRCGVVLAGVLLAGCGLEDKDRPLFHDPGKSTPEFSKTHLSDGFDDDTAADFLLPEEREAVRRSGMTGSRLAEDPSAEMGPMEPEQPKGPIGRAFDTVGKVGVALLQVGVVLGMLVAPLFMV